MSIYLEIQNVDNLDLDKFCEYLIGMMREYLLTEIDKMQTKRFDDYIKEKGIIKSIYRNGKTPMVKDILVASTSHLIVNKVNSNYIIKLNPNAKIPNTSAKFIEIIKLVDEGNLEVKRYPIYSDMTDFFAKNLYYFYNKWLGE